MSSLTLNHKQPETEHDNSTLCLLQLVSAEMEWYDWLQDPVSAQRYTQRQLFHTIKHDESRTTEVGLAMQPLNEESKYLQFCD